MPKPQGQAWKHHDCNSGVPSRKKHGWMGGSGVGFAFSQGRFEFCFWTEGWIAKEFLDDAGHGTCRDHGYKVAPCGAMYVPCMCNVCHCQYICSSSGPCGYSAF